MKMKYLFLTFVATLVSSLFIMTVRTDNTYAACTDGNGHFFLGNTGYYSSFSELGGNGADDKGISWACGGDARAVLFFVGSAGISASGGNYTFYGNNSVNLESTSNTVLFAGMVHNKTSSASNGNADGIRLCTNQSCTSTDTYIFTNVPYNFARSPSGDATESSTGWTRPRTSAGMIINGPHLAEYIDSGRAVKHFDETSGYGVVQVQNYRCYGTTSNTSGCGWSPMWLSYNRPVATTFSGSVQVVSPTGTSASSPIKTDSSTYTVQFKHTVKRNNDGPNSSIRTQYRTKSATGSYSGYNWTNYLSKNGSQVVRNTNVTVSLNEGLNTICETLEYNNKATPSGTTGSYMSASACVYIYRYKWTNINGRVQTSSDNATYSASYGAWFTDNNTANAKFEHQLKAASFAVKALWYTGLDTVATNLGFSRKSTVQTSSLTTSWQTVFTSSKNNIAIPANDAGITIMQYLYHNNRSREDFTGSNGSSGRVTSGYVTETGQIKLRRYHTKFNGTTTVKVNNVARTNGSTITITGGVPTAVSVAFTHTVQRTNAGSPISSPSAKSIKLGTTATSTGVRVGDATGTSKAYGTYGSALSANGTVSYTDSFTTYIYPEQVITYCQKMTYTSDIYGQDYFDGNTSNTCVTLRMDKASCMGDQYGVHNGKNLGTMILNKRYRNSSGGIATSSLKKEKINTGNNIINMYAKPGDAINYSYAACASADLANQFSYLNKPTRYDISASQQGYLFGTDVGTATGGKYLDTSVNLGVTKATAGQGPFSGNSYTKEFNSPNSSSTEYSCTGTGYFTNSSKSASASGYYQITGDLRNTLNNTNCKSYKHTAATSSFGIGTNVGRTFYQKLEWTDLWIANDIVNSAHNGTAKASITGNVIVPYNYDLKPYVTTTTSGSVVPGGNFNFNAYLPVVKKVNKDVQNDAYATHSKPTKVRVIATIIRNGVPKTGTIKLTSAAGGETATNLCAAITQSGSYVNCTLLNDSSSSYDIKSNYSYILNGSIANMTDGTHLNTSKIANDAASLVDTNNSNIKVALTNGSALGSGSFTIPVSNQYSVGDKICVAVAAWPGDSHDGVSTAATGANQTNALRDGGSASTYWSISAPSCTSIAKRPMFSVEGGDLLSAGKVKASHLSYNGRNYTSWAEYGIHAAGLVTDMASGAGVAYIDAQTYRTSVDSTIRAIGLDSVNRVGTSGIRNTVSETVKQTQTITNNVSTATGNYTAIKDSEIFNKVVDAVKGIYTRKTSGDYDERAGVKDFKNIKTIKKSDGTTYEANFTAGGKSYSDITPHTTYPCIYDNSLGIYKPHTNDNQRATLYDGTKSAPSYCLPNGSRYYYSSTNAYIGPRKPSIIQTQFSHFVNDLTGDEVETYRNTTRVYRTEGDLVIDSNFILDNLDNGQYKDVYDGVQSIPQVILMAKNIYITGSVTRLDAWLIADNTINTCAYANWEGFTAGTYLKEAGTGSALRASYCERELVVNGPAFAKKVILNRNAGGGTTVTGFATNGANLQLNMDSYTQRGEIFNLRPDAYLWSYYQAQRNGILSSVFVKEVPTRY